MTLPKPIRTSSSRFFVGLIVLAVAFSGCTEAETSGDPVAASTPLYFEPIGQGHRASLADSTAMEMVIRERSEWRQVSDSLRPVAPFDSVAFDQTIVLLVALPQTTSGYSVEFTSVEETDSVAVAKYVINAPSDDCLTALADVVPFQAVMVRQTPLPVRFESSTQEYRCTIGPRR